MKNMKSAQGGFTLIELMITLAILAILLAIAVPQYQNYSIRTRVTECVNLAAAAKLAVAETAQALGGLANLTAANSGYTGVATANCAAIAITDATGVITAQTLGAGTGAGEDFNLVFTPAQAAVGDPITWVCTNAATNPAHVPSGCR